VNPEEEKETLRWGGFAEKEDFKSGMRERERGGDGKTVIISMTIDSPTAIDRQT